MVRQVLSLHKIFVLFLGDQLKHDFREFERGALDGVDHVDVALKEGAHRFFCGKFLAGNEGTFREMWLGNVGTPTKITRE